MKRGNLFFIGLLSAVTTFISLTYALGRPGFYNNRYHYYNRYHHCYDNYDDRIYRNHQPYNDSTNSNY